MSENLEKRVRELLIIKKKSKIKAYFEEKKIELIDSFFIIACGVCAAYYITEYKKHGEVTEIHYNEPSPESILKGQMYDENNIDDEKVIRTIKYIDNYIDNILKNDSDLDLANLGCTILFIENYLNWDDQTKQKFQIYQNKITQQMSNKPYSVRKEYEKKKKEIKQILDRTDLDDKEKWDYITTKGLPTYLEMRELEKKLAD